MMKRAFGGGPHPLFPIGTGRNLFFGEVAGNGRASHPNPNGLDLPQTTIADDIRRMPEFAFKFTSLLTSRLENNACPGSNSRPVDYPGGKRCFRSFLS